MADILVHSRQKRCVFVPACREDSVFDELLPAFRRSFSKCSAVFVLPVPAEMPDGRLVWYLIEAEDRFGYSYRLQALAELGFMSANVQTIPSSPSVALLNNVNLGLDGVWAQARKACQELFPSYLPARVFIKPNLCDIVAWEAGVTTDPAWLYSLVPELRAIRPDVKISVVESDAISAYKTYRSCDETFERLGFVAAADELGIDLINLSRARTFEISLPPIPFPVRIPELFLEEFFFISIANLKVHPYEHMTGVLKNSLGLLPDADISRYHPYLPIIISALHRLCPSDLCIIDARVGLEGKGPIIGDPVAMHSLIFANDALAADLLACRLMMISPEDVPHLRSTARDLGRSFADFSVFGQVVPRKFLFDPQNVHEQILMKFANQRLHRASERFSNRWIDRFLRFKRQPFTFLVGAIPKLAKRVYGR